MKTILLWLSFAVCVVAGILLSGLSVSMLLQPTAGLIVLVPVALYLLYSLGSGLRPFLGRSLRQELTEDDNRIIGTACSLGYLFAVIGMVIGFVMVMSNLSNPAQIGPGIATSVVSILYGAVPSIMLLPLRSPSRHSSGIAGISQKAAGFMVIAFFMMTTDLFVVLYALR